VRRFTDQAYVRTRLAIMGTKLLSREEFAKLVAMSLDELSAASRFDTISGESNAARLITFERTLMQTWLDELSALLRPLKGSARRLLTHWASRYEVLNIKALVRGKIGQLPNEEIEKTLFRLPGFLSLNHDQLLNTDNVVELLRQLQKTPYQRLATQALRRYEERPDPFLLDATLDQQFYGELIDRAHHLSGTDRAEILALIGRIVDGHNLVWSLRYRYNYGLQASEVLYLAIDGGRALDRSRLQEMLHADTLAEALGHLPDGVPGHGEMPRQIPLIEATMRNELFAYATRAMRHSPSALTSVLSYLVLRYSGINQLYTIVHARVYGLSDELLHEALDPLHEEAA